VKALRSLQMAVRTALLLIVVVALYWVATEYLPPDAVVSTARKQGCNILQTLAASPSHIMCALNT
jgi:hypothetical protein